MCSILDGNKIGHLPRLWTVYPRKIPFQNFTACDWKRTQDSCSLFFFHLHFWHILLIALLSHSVCSTVGAKRVGLRCPPSCPYPLLRFSCWERPCQAFHIRPTPLGIVPPTLDSMLQRRAKLKLCG